MPFPIDLPESSRARFHRIVVAHGVLDRIRKEAGNRGELGIRPDIIGDAHLKAPDDGGRPFTVGQINPGKGFVHVLDESSLETVLTELDTISDFVAYLEKKEALFFDSRFDGATGEQELLGRYLLYTNDAGDHHFNLPAKSGMVIGNGHWESFKNGPQRRSRIAANTISHSWDRLIEIFSQITLAGQQYHPADSDIRDTEKILRFMAREPRT